MSDSKLLHKTVSLPGLRELGARTYKKSTKRPAAVRMAEASKLAKCCTLTRETKNRFNNSEENNFVVIAKKPVSGMKD